MAQLASIENQAFFPTPPSVTALILKWIQSKPNTNVRCFDPCSGNGIALKALENALKAWGSKTQALAIENDRERAQETATLLGAQNTLHCDFHNSAISDQAFGAVWFNPPYQTDMVADEEGNYQRQELAFIERTTDKLQPEGVLICIVQQHMLGRKKFVRHLVTRYEQLRVLSFPDPEFARFGQVIILGKKRKALANDESVMTRLANFARQRPPAIDKYPQTNTYAVPPAILDAITFQEIRIEDAKLLEMVIEHGVETRKQWKTHVEPKEETTFRPVLRLKRGHVAGLIAAGFTGVLLLGKEPERLMLRGRAIKETIYLDAGGNPLPDDCDSEDIRGEREVFATEIHVLYENGRYQLINKDNIAEFEKLLAANADIIEQRIQEKYPPLYTKPSLPKWRKLGTLMKGRHLPNREETGLLTNQKHAVLALDAALDHFRTVNLIAKPGCGKTPMAAALAHVRNAWPALAVVPATAVEHWKRDFEATIPGGKAFIAENVADVNAFMRDYRKGEMKLLIMSMQTAKLGPGITQLNQDLRENPIRRWLFSPTPGPRRNYRLRQARRKPHYNVLAAPALTPRLNRVKSWLWKKRHPKPTKRSPHPGRPGSPRPSLRWVQEIQEPISEDAAPKKLPPKLKPVCPACGGVVEIKGQTPRCDNYRPMSYWDARIKDWKSAECNEALYAYGPTRKWLVARYIYDKHKGKFKLFIADEAHEFKAGDTDAGMAHALLTKACKWTVNLTGTFAGGYATDIFHLFYRALPAIREEFGFRDAMRFCGLHGKLKFSYRNVGDRDTDDLDVGALSGKRRHSVNIDPLPGYMPTIFQYLLPNTVFMDLVDLGYKKVECYEHIVPIQMTETMRRQYNWLENELLEDIRKYIRSKEKDERRYALNLMSRYLHSCLYYGGACYREQEITYKSISSGKQAPFHVSTGRSNAYGYTAARDREAIAAGARDHYRTMLDIDRRHSAPDSGGSNVMILHPAVGPGELTPKEEWLVNLLQREKAAGRKTLLYVMQTDTRSIVERQIAILRHHGIRVQQLPKGSKASEREAWIRRTAPQIDVLICNPASVKTSLNLIDFCTVVDLEAQSSLYQKLQSSQRTNRPTQTKTVHIYYPVYEDSLEWQLLQLMREKAFAAVLLCGDTAESALADIDSDDIMAELTRRVLTGTKAKPIEGDTFLEEIGRHSYFAEIFAPVIDEMEAAVHQAPPVAKPPAAPKPLPQPLPQPEPLPAAVPKHVATQWQQPAPPAPVPARSGKLKTVHQDQLSLF